MMADGLGVDLLKKAAERGDARACYWLGELHYHQGTTELIGEAEAVEYYIKGAQLGDPD
jgi:TPR repeat protein